MAAHDATKSFAEAARPTSPLMRRACLLVLALGVGACGGSDTPSADPTTSTSSGGDMAAFQECVTSHGATLPAGGGLAGGGAGVSEADRQKLQAALQACRDKLPAGLRERSGGGLAYADCLRERGADAAAAMRSPSSSDDPKVVAAREACKHLAPPTATTAKP